MSDQEMHFSPSFKLGILKLMVDDHAFCMEACYQLKREYFSGEYRWFFNTIKAIYSEFRRKVNYEDIEVWIYKEHGKEHVYLEMLEKIKVNDVTPDIIKREMTAYRKAMLLAEKLPEVINLYNTQSTRNDAFNYMEDFCNQLIKINFEGDGIAKFSDIDNILDSMKEQHANAIPTGIRLIDEALGGGLLPQSWTTFIGGSNAGKSMLMPNLAWFAAQRGKKVFVTVHEDEKDQTLSRYMARFSGIPLTKLVSCPFTGMDEDMKKRYLEGKRLLQEHVHISFMYGEDRVVEKVCQVAKIHHKDWPFDLFLCDYGQLLTTKRVKQFDAHRQVLEYVYSSLKQLCLELNIAGAGGAQVNRQGHAASKAGTQFLRMSDVGESWGIAQMSSNVITINRSNEDAENNRIVFLLDKIRNGKGAGGLAVQCLTKFDICATHLSELEGGDQGPVEIKDGPAARADGHSLKASSS